MGSHLMWQRCVTWTQGEVNVVDSAVQRGVDQVLDFWRGVHLLRVSNAYGVPNA
jgi:hypothetical protein